MAEHLVDLETSWPTNLLIGNLVRPPLNYPHLVCCLFIAFDQQRQWRLNINSTYLAHFLFVNKTKMEHLFTNLVLTNNFAAPSKTAKQDDFTMSSSPQLLLLWMDICIWFKYDYLGNKDVQSTHFKSFWDWCRLAAGIMIFLFRWKTSFCSALCWNRIYFVSWDG